MSYSQDDLKGVGGWLAFLCISLIALSPLFSLITSYIEISDTEAMYPTLRGNPTWTTAKLVSWVMVFAQIGLMIFTGLRLNSSTRRSTINFARIMLWVCNPLMSLISLLVLSLIFRASLLDDPKVLSDLARGIFWALIWTLYLTFSRRVRNTYTDEDEGEVAAVFE
jgi:hypothetical protein